MNKRQRVILGLCLAALLAPGRAQAATEWKQLKDLDLKARPQAVISAQDGKRVFILTIGEVLLYSPQENKILDKLPVGKEFDLIARVESDDSLLLVSSKTGKLAVFTLDVQHKVFTEGLPFAGPATAPVTLSVVSDYQCPSCAQLDPILASLLEKYGNSLRIVHKNFPISSHQFARESALAALAAWKQGKFQDYHKKLFENQAQIDEQYLVTAAKEVGLELDRFNADRQGPELTQLLDKDVANAKEIGVQGTPSLFVNGRPLKNRSMPGLYQLIDEELAKAK